MKTISDILRGIAASPDALLYFAGIGYENGHRRGKRPEGWPMNSEEADYTERNRLYRAAIEASGAETFYQYLPDFEIGLYRFSACAEILGDKVVLRIWENRSQYRPAGDFWQDERAEIELPGAAIWSKKALSETAEAYVNARRFAGGTGHVAFLQSVGHSVAEQIEVRRHILRLPKDYRPAYDYEATKKAIARRFRLDVSGIGLEDPEALRAAVRRGKQDRLTPVYFSRALEYAFWEAYEATDDDPDPETILHDILAEPPEPSPIYI